MEKKAESKQAGSANAEPSPPPTPGPWEAHRNVGALLGSDERQPFVVSSAAGWVGLFNRKEDAELAAAAPQLADALAEVLHRTKENGYNASEVAASRERAEAALKAAGWTPGASA